MGRKISNLDNSRCQSATSDFLAKFDGEIRKLWEANSSQSVLGSHVGDFKEQISVYQEGGSISYEMLTSTPKSRLDAGGRWEGIGMDCRWKRGCLFNLILGRFKRF